MPFVCIDLIDYVVGDCNVRAVDNWLPEIVILLSIKI